MSAMQAVEDRELGRRIVEAAEETSTACGDLYDLLRFIERLRWRDSQQGQIMCAVREAIEGGDYGRIPALMTALDATHREDAEEHEAVQHEAACTREHLAKITRDLDQPPLVKGAPEPTPMEQHGLPEEEPFAGGGAGTEQALRVEPDPEFEGDVQVPPESWEPTSLEEFNECVKAMQWPDADRKALYAKACTELWGGVVKIGSLNPQNFTDLFRAMVEIDRGGGR